MQEQEFPMDLSMRSSMSSGSASDSMSLSLSTSTSASGPVSSKFLFPSGPGRPHPLISSSSHSYRSLSSESGSKVTGAYRVTPDLVTMTFRESPWTPRVQAGPRGCVRCVTRDSASTTDSPSTWPADTR